MNNYYIEKKLKIEKIKYISVLATLLITLFIVGLMSVCMGAMDITVSDVFKVMAGKIFGTEPNVAENILSVIWNIRLPRIICSCFIGMGLAVSGAIFQAILQNPLADPYTIGISTGASFGASAAITVNLIFGIYFPTVSAALIGAFVTLFIVILIARKGGSFNSSNIVIAGIIVSSVLSSGVSFMKILAGENVGAIVFWIMGSLSAKGWSDVIIVAPICVILTIISVFFAKSLDIMALGDEAAGSLGVNVNRARFLYLTAGSVITAVCVSVCGVIGFVGLIVPHLIRFWITARNRALIPLSALFGALLLMTADTFARLISSGEIPVGILTTLIGGPFFIFIFMKKRVGG